MSRTLGGTFFVRNGIEFDYNFVEAVKSLQDFCDEVVIVDAGSDDGTTEMLHDIADKKTTIIRVSKQDWDNQHGKEKLNYFQNIAIRALQTDYNFLCQADECVHEDSYSAIREAIETGLEAFMCTRINLWKDCNHQLNVPQERKPCSTQVIRLAKSNFMSYGDGESLEVPCVYGDWMDRIRIYHYGFVRKKEVMKSKIINMQRNVFQIDPDKKLDGMEIFDWSAWFSENDLIPIKEQHPAIMQEWISKRP